MVRNINKSIGLQAGAFCLEVIMLEKAKRPKKLNNQDRQIPTNIQELINRYDLDNLEIYDFLDYLVNYLNERGI